MYVQSSLTQFHICFPFAKVQKIARWWRRFKRGENEVGKLTLHWLILSPPCLRPQHLADPR